MKRIVAFFITLCVSLSAAPIAYAETPELDFFEVFNEHGAIMLIIESGTGEIEYANRAASAFYGYEVEQLESMNIDQINQLTPEETRNEMQLAVVEHRNYFVFKHQLASGDVRTVEVYSYPYDDGNRTLLFSVITDITEKVLLSEKNRMMNESLQFSLLSIVIILSTLCFLLYRSQKRLKEQKEEIENFNELRTTFIDADRSLVYLKDEKLKYIFLNKAFEQFWGKKSAEIIGNDDFGLTDKKLALQFNRLDQEVLEKRANVVEEVKWKGKVYQTNRFPVKLSNGHYGVGAYIRDVTEEYSIRRQSEKALFRNLILVEVLNRNYQSTQEQLDYVLNETLKLTESKLGYIYIYDEGNEEFIINSWSKEVMPQCAVIDQKTKYQLNNTGIWGEVVRQKKPIIVNDFQSPNPLKKGYPEGHVQLTKFMSIPVFIDGKIVAVVGLANKEKDYDDSDIYQVTALMNGVWNAKERRERTLQLEKTNIVLKENQDKLQLILDSTAEAIYGVDMEGNCTFCNNSCLRILGYDHQDELIGKKIHWHIHHTRRDGRPLPLDECRIVLALNKGEGVHVDDEVFWRADGTCFDVEYYSYPQYRDGEIVGAVITFMDITERKRAEEEVLYLSYHDSLTGLYNRRFFEEKLILLDNEENLPISVIMGDVNGLKLANDVFGHAVGDQLLQRVAQIIKSNCRREDVVARWGGDEFIIILPKTKREDAEEICRRVKNLLSKEKIQAISGSISFGCDTKNCAEDNLLEVIENAEDFMYKEKSYDHKTYNKNAIKAILQTLHKRSPGEEAHSTRVSELCLEIGRAMRLSEEELCNLRDAGFLHDIGKVVLEDSLLNHNGNLTRQQWQEIKQHPLVGYRILNSSEDTSELSKYVLSHHERWDGLGYPKGLQGEKIPKLARIIAVAEHYDAMTNESSNDRAMRKDEAIREIQNNAGSKFDPYIVKMLFEVLKPSARRRS